MKKSAVVSMMFSILIVLLWVIAEGEKASAESISSSLGVVAYPAKGQPAKQQSKDEGECFAWAKQQTGIDPKAVASQPTKQEGPAVGGGERARGAASGAVGGLAVGAIAGDAGKGAAIGALAAGAGGFVYDRATANKRRQQ